MSRIFFEDLPEAINPVFIYEVSSLGDFFVMLFDDDSGGVGPDPPAAKLRFAMRDLVSAYAEQQDEVKEAWDRVREVQDELRAEGIREIKRGTPADPGHVLRELLKPAMLRVAEDNGFPADEKGLRCFQNVVRRRITEGDRELQKLSNKALALLGYPVVKSIAPEMSAEEMMCKVADDNGPHSKFSAERFFEHCEVDEYDLRKLQRELQRLHAELQPLTDVSLGLLSTWSMWEMRGLPRALRTRAQEAPPVVRLHRPSVRVVFEHVMRHQPLVITGALDERTFPPLRDFADFEYLRRRCGWRKVRTKVDGSLDKEGRKLFLNDPNVSITLAEFLDQIEEAERTGRSIPFYMGKVRLTDELPELQEDLDKATSSPWKKYGGCFGDLETPAHTYFGCGRNTTSLHTDASENILVVLSGTKTFEMYPPCQADCLYTGISKPLNSMVPPFTRPEAMKGSVAERFPLFQHARPVRVDLVAGDLFYLPAFWWHGVTGGSERNMLVNWWSFMHPSKKDVGEATEGARSVMNEYAKLQPTFKIDPQAQ